MFPMNDYDIDGFRTMTWRCDRDGCGIVAEGLRVLHYGDSVVLVVTGVGGCVPADLVFGVYADDGSNIAEVSNTGFDFVPGRADAIYAYINFQTGNAETLAGTLAHGDAADVRVYLYETGGRTWIDSGLEFYPNPAVAGGTSNPQNAYVTKTALSQLAQAVLAMPDGNAYLREQRFLALVNGLAALAAP